MSILSDQIIAAYQELLFQTNDPLINQALSQIEIDQKYHEKELISRTSVCDVPMLDSLHNKISSLRGNELKDITMKEFYNPAAMKATMCAVDSLFYSSPTDVGSLSLNERIRLYINNLRQIGNESVEGYAMLANFDDAKDLFVVKVSRTPTADNLLHELIIGLFGTNKLRQYVPNFSYVYGGFKCSPPLIDSNSREVVTWCLNTENSVNYVLYENINPSVSMEDYIKTCTGKEFLNAYMQTLYALRLANPILDFTHFDLHYNNVLIRRINSKKSSKFQIIYETEQGIEYITADKVSTIIDYGFSHIIIPETQQHDGRSRLVPYSIYPNRSWIMHDLYKLLMFSMFAAQRFNNQQVLEETAKIFRYFNSVEDPLIAIRAQFPVYFSLPITDVTDKFTIDNLARHIRSVCDCDFISSNRSSDPVLDCEHMCLTEDSVFNKIGMDISGSIPVPNNILEFYNLMIKLQNQGREQERQQIGNAFPYQKAMTNHVRKINNLVRDLMKLRRQLKLIDVTSMNSDQLLNYNTMMIVRSMYITMATIVDKISDLTLNYNVGIAIAQAYEDQTAIDVLNNTMDRFSLYTNPSIEEAKKILSKNHEYLDAIAPQFSNNPLISKDNRLRWYWEGRSLFDVILGLKS